MIIRLCSEINHNFSIDIKSYRGIHYLFIYSQDGHYIHIYNHTIKNMTIDII